jgi:hypothetical protein
VQGFLISSLVLILILAIGVAAIVATRSRMFGDAAGGRPGSGHGDWESALVGYKNLRDKGVLTEEEYRKITTLVEPHVRTEPSGRIQRHPQTVGPAAGGHEPSLDSSPKSPNPARK